jgi:hypothetical protein
MRLMLTDRRILVSGPDYAPPNSQWLPRYPFIAVAHHAGRKATPFGISPVMTSRQNAISSLRASAAIIVFRVPPRPSEVRA